MVAGEDEDEAPPRLSRGGFGLLPTASGAAAGADLCCASMLTPMLGDAGIVSRVEIAGLGDEAAFLTDSSLDRSGSGGRRSSITAGSLSERRAGRGGLPPVLVRLALGDEVGIILLKV